MSTVKLHLTPNIITRILFIIDNHHRLGSNAVDQVEPLLMIQSRYKQRFETYLTDDDKRTEIPPFTPPTDTTKQKRSLLDLADKTISSPLEKTCTGFITFPDLQLVISLCQKLKYNNGIDNHLHNVIENTSLCYHIPPKSHYTPEFAAYIQMLRSKNHKEEYEAVMSNLPQFRGKVQRDHLDSKYMTKNMASIGAPLNLLAFAATCGFIFYIISTHIFQSNKPMQTTFTIIGVLVGFIIETLLFVIRDYNAHQNENNSKKQLKKDDLVKMREYRDAFIQQQQLAGHMPTNLPFITKSAPNDKKIR